MIRKSIAAIAAAGVLAVAAPAMLPGAPVAQAQALVQLPSFAPLVRATQPAVVSIRVEGTGPARGAQIDPRMQEFMERFFGRDFPGIPQQRGNQRRPMGMGSGFIVDGRGMVVTNNHVIDGGDQITVVLSNGEEYDAVVIGTDPSTDLAVLRIDAGYNLPSVGWGDSDTVEVGDWAIAIGNPFGLGSSVTAGIVSARGRNIRSGPYDDFLQVDAPINRGNSGGPLFNDRGEVIGVNTAIYSPSGGNVGIGFAIPSNQAASIVADLIDDGSVDRGWLGVSIQPVTEEIAAALGLEQASGVMIAEVVSGGPAQSGGIQRGDVILFFGETPIEDVRDLTRTVADTNPGTQTTVRVWRRGSEQDLSVRTGRFPT